MKVIFLRFVHVASHSLRPEILAVQGFGFTKFSLTLFLIGNDLARALRWGAGYTGEKVMNVLRSVEDANLIKLDRQVEREGKEGEGREGEGRGRRKRSPFSPCHSSLLKQLLTTVKMAI